MTPPPVFDVFLRLLSWQRALGGAIGLEREYRHKPAGLRTNMLIALGSALFSVMSIDLGAAAGSPDRIAARVVTRHRVSRRRRHPSQRRERSRPHDGSDHLGERGDQAWPLVSAHAPLRQSRRGHYATVVLAFLPVMERLFERRERPR